MLTSLYSESYDDDDSLCPREEMRQVLKQKARNLFMLCDQENKGFASKRDIYRLENELPLTPEQLDEVFDVLDKDKNGCLTLEEFTEGLGMFLGIDSHIVRQDEDDENTDTVHTKQAQEVDEKFEDFLDCLGAQHVFKDEDYVRNMWEKVNQDDPVMLRNLENFLGKITQELKNTKNENSSLENTLRNRTNIHDEQVQVLYTEMEEQLKAEKEILLANERSKEQKIRDELETELHLKDQQVQDFIMKHAEMEKRLQELNADDSEKKHENIKLEKERDTLELRLAASDKMLKDMQRHLELLRKKSLEEKRTRAKAVLKVSEGIALERESLVKELLHLKKANKQLLDEKDELVNTAIGTPNNGSEDDSSESSNIEKHVSFNLPCDDKRSPRTSKRYKKFDGQRHPHRSNRNKADEVERSAVSCHPLSCCEEYPKGGAEVESDLGRL